VTAEMETGPHRPQAPERALHLDPAVNTPIPNPFPIEGKGSAVQLLTLLLTARLRRVFLAPASVPDPAIGSAARRNPNLSKNCKGSSRSDL
jgi:hypothetical protein